MNTASISAESVVAFWFPDGPSPEPKAHMDLWMWRMRGGANAEVLERYTDLTQLAADGGLDDWAETPIGRLALIILLDQFPRTVWAGTPKAYAQDPKALHLCIEGLENGHFDSLGNVWYKMAYRIPLAHCECADHLANLDRVVAMAQALADEAPDSLKGVYNVFPNQAKLIRDVIATFGRHPHRNEVLGRTSTDAERAYISKGTFPHQTDLRAMAEDLR